MPGRWLAIDVAPDGTLKQKPADLAFAFPLVRVFDMRFDLVLNGEPAWFIQRGGEPAGDLVRRGALERMAKDDLVGHVLEEGGALTAHAFAMDCRGDAAGAAP